MNRGYSAVMPSRTASLGFSARRRWRSPRRRSAARTASANHVRLHAELAQRQQLLVHEQVALDAG